MLLLLHGAMGHAGDLEQIMKYLPQEWECKTINFPGHGGTEATSFGTEVFVQSIADFMNEHQLEKIDLFGYSMGGYIAVQFAIKYPEKVTRIMTLNTIWNWDESITQKMVASLDPEKIKVKVPAFAQQLEGIHAPGSWEKLAENTAAYLRTLHAMGGMDESKLKAIQLPIRILRGELDPIVSADSSQTMANSMANGSYAEVKEGKHTLDQIDTKELAEMMVLFF